MRLPPRSVRWWRKPGSTWHSMDLVGLHGQTVFPSPGAAFHAAAGRWCHLAHRLGRPVVNRFRHADVAAGGQGAPLGASVSCRAGRHASQTLMVLNLGGVANITYLDGAGHRACDTGPASALIDDAMQRHFALPMTAMAPWREPARWIRPCWPAGLITPSSRCRRRNRLTGMISTG